MYRTRKWEELSRDVEIWPICIPTYNRPNPKAVKNALPGLPIVLFVRKEQKELYTLLKSQYPGCKIVTLSNVHDLGETRAKIVKWASYHGHKNIFMLDDDITSVDYLYPGKTSGGSICMRGSRINNGEKSRLNPSGFRVWQYIVENRLDKNTAITTPIYRPDSWHLKNKNAKFRYNAGACMQCVHLNIDLLSRCNLNYGSNKEYGVEDLSLQFWAMEKGLKTCVITDLVYNCPPINSEPGGCEGANGIDDPEKRYSYYVKQFFKNVCKGNHPGVGIKTSRSGFKSIKFNWKYWSGKIERRTDMEELKNAIEAIKGHWATRLELSDGTIVYKVPSNNPNKYTIRIDIKVVEEC